MSYSMNNAREPALTWAVCSQDKQHVTMLYTVKAMACVAIPLIVASEITVMQHSNYGYFSAVFRIFTYFINNLSVYFLIVNK